MMLSYGKKEDVKMDIYKKSYDCKIHMKDGNVIVYTIDISPVLVCDTLYKKVDGENGSEYVPVILYRPEEDIKYDTIEFLKTVLMEFMEHNLIHEQIDSVETELFNHKVIKDEIIGELMYCIYDANDKS